MTWEKGRETIEQLLLRSQIEQVPADPDEASSNGLADTSTRPSGKPTRIQRSPTTRSTLPPARR